MWEKITAITAVCLLTSVIGTIIWNECATKEYTVTINLEDKQDPFEALPKLMPSNQITNIKEVDKNKNEYQVTIRSKEKSSTILRWLLSNRRVKDASIK